MVESAKVTQGTQKLSAQDRLTLIQTLNALPQPQFDELVFALNPPNANVPSNSAPQGDRTTALLQWAESPVGPGLQNLERILGKIIGKASHTAEEFLSFAIAGNLGDMSPAELQAIVELLRKKTGDDSIEIAFSRKGSIKLILSGSPDGLKKLQELYESGELEDLTIPLVEDVQSVENNTTDARKAQLVQALKLRRKFLIITRALTFARDRSHARVHRFTQTRTSVFALALVLTLALAITLAFALTRYSPAALFFALALAPTLTLTLIQIRDLDRVLEQIHDLDRVLNLDLDLDLGLARNLDHVLDRILDLRNADLSSTNLKNIDLSGADLTNADLSNADVTGTIFGNNKGLTETDKYDLKRRGALFQEPPSSELSRLMVG